VAAVGVERLREDAPDDADGRRDGGGGAGDVRVGEVDDEAPAAVGDADAVGGGAGRDDLDLRAPQHPVAGVQTHVAYVMAHTVGPRGGRAERQTSERCHP